MSHRLALGALLVGVVLFPTRAWAQDASIDVAPAINLEQVRTPVQMPDAPAGTRSRLLPSLYVSTAVMQMLDVHSTLSAVGGGAGVEGNPMAAPMTSHPAAFVAAKSAVAATTIFAAHRLSKNNKAAAIGLLVAINSAYALVVSHNYHVAGAR